MKRNACRPVPTQGNLPNQCCECGKEVTDDRETECSEPVVLPESIWAVISIPRYIYNPHSHVIPLECNYSYILRFLLCAQVVPFAFCGYTLARFPYPPFSSTSTSLFGKLVNCLASPNCKLLDHRTQQKNTDRLSNERCGPSLYTSSPPHSQLSPSLLKGTTVEAVVVVTFPTPSSR